MSQATTTRTLTFSQAIREALREEMERDDRVFVWGEDVAVYGGIYGATAGLLEQFGPGRVIDTPISETMIVGAAVGAAITGLRPVAELQSSGYFGIAMD
ncbi:MAG: alpha-ketoacid dehydrogenase subunit beta, partial [bacterium]|nr:alpha-ketoacid dehydrogenase subunit beta [bacterium]